MSYMSRGKLIIVSVITIGRYIGNRSRRFNIHPPVIVRFTVHNRGASGGLQDNLAGIGNILACGHSAVGLRNGKLLRPSSLPGEGWSDGGNDGGRKH